MCEECKQLRAAALEFYNATVASQKESPGFNPDYCVTVGATHKHLCERIDRASDNLEKVLRETKGIK